jgi:cyclopropane-fatty-acyl-phospholipid synthase
VTTTTFVNVQNEVRPEALLSRAEQSWLSSLRPSGRAMAGNTARRVVHALLQRMTADRLIVDDDLTRRTGFGPAVYGAEAAELVGEIIVHDARAYVALVTEGAIGLGRGYIEGWWDSPDPVTTVRVIIRNMAPIDGLRNRVHRRTGWATDRIRAARAARGRAANRNDIAAHYDLGNAFFELFLDETMTYSSAVFTSMDSTLADASLLKYDLLLAKLGVDRSHRLLEIGTGWGGLAIRAAESTGCHVTTTTISSEQFSE